MDFVAARALLPHLQALHVSHLYLSPIFTARPASSHGYDIRRPDEIDPALGGADGFFALAKAAQTANIGLILDIVPNHLAFDLGNPWLWDLLRNGESSRYRRHFDIESDRPLILPFLPMPLEALLRQDTASVAQEADGPVLRIAGLAVPLRGDDLIPGQIAAEECCKLVEQQLWRLTDGAAARTDLSHRRFFTVTELIGMRVEDPAVFADMHSLIFDLADRGLVQGLRIDHIDGLADPEGYLERLAARLPHTPVWVEKILTGRETLKPRWPVVGTTGYEAAAEITSLLSRPSGIDRLTALWSRETGEPGDYAACLARAKQHVARNDFVPELRQLARLADDVLSENGLAASADDLQEVIVALLVEMPRYRTYFSEGTADAEDLLIWEKVAERAAAASGNLLVEPLAIAISDARSPSQRRWRNRFQQVTGALMAKSHEDTAFFRYTPFLALNEVGSHPGRNTGSVEEFSAFCQSRVAAHPASLTLTSSHDTKRAEDARTRLVALSHMPERFQRLMQAAASLAGAKHVKPSILWYLVQSAVAIWEPDRADVADRLSTHMEKALREAKEITSWHDPDVEAEGPILALASELVAKWLAEPPQDLMALVTRAETLSLCQIALKLVIPGVPDFYNGSEMPVFWLTDPDNRRLVERTELTNKARASRWDQRKQSIIQQLMQARMDDPALFLSGSVTAYRDQTALVLTRTSRSKVLSLTLWPERDEGPFADLSILPLASVDSAATG